MTGEERRKETAWLKVGVAFVWLATGILVVHPLYRSIGASYLARLGLPVWVMPVTCAFEIGLGIWVAFGRASDLLTLLQISMVATFTVILALLEPKLLVSPFGVLTKNVPILACVLAAWFVEREGWSRRACIVLRFGMAFVWLSEGLFPKILFQQPEELVIAQHSGVAFGHPSSLLVVIGSLQIASGVLALTLRGRLLRFVLGAQVAALVVLPVLVSWQVPWLWFHPFGPLIKNAPLLTGTVLALRKCSS